MARTNGSKSSWLSTLAATVVVVGALYFARELLIPLALSILLSFLLAPLVRWLERLKLGRVPAVIVVTILSFAVIGAIGWIVTEQVLALAADVPQYRGNIKAKLQSLRGAGGSLFGELKKTAKELNEELVRPSTTQATQEGSGVRGEGLGGPERASDPGLSSPTDRSLTTGPAAAGLSETNPVFHAADPPPSTPLDLLRSTLDRCWGRWAMRPLSSCLSSSSLAYREDMRDRFLGLIGPQQINATTQALDDAGRRVSRYLLMQLLVNVTYGVPVAIGLYFIGVPNAFLVGLLATLLRFVPYLGPVIGASLPIVLSLIISPDWTQPLMTAGLFIVVELISNNLVEPWLYGSSTGLSPVAIIVAAVFWTWLWGPIGLLLSTPLTVCLVVIGKYVPPLAFLGVLLGDEPVLEPKSRIYQRLLALDREEASELLEESLKEQRLVEVYDGALLPALGLAEQDRHGGDLDEQRHQFVLDSIRGLVDELAEQEEERSRRTRSRRRTSPRVHPGIPTCA